MTHGDVTTNDTGNQCWSRDDEHFRCESLGELLGNEGDLNIGDTVYVGDAHRPSVSVLCDAEDVLDTMRDRASDIAGEYAEDYPDVTAEAEAELNAMLTAWIEKHAKPTFYTVSNVREYILTDDDFANACDTSKAVA